MAIYVQRNSQRLGPYTVAEVRSQLASGALSLKDHVWWTGQEGWIPLVGSPVLKPDFVDPDPAVKKKSDGLTGLSSFAIASVIAGIVPLAFFSSISAIIFGVFALDEIKKNPGRTGRRLAFVGIALGIFFTLVWGAAAGCWYYFRDDIEAMNMREQAVESQPFVPPVRPQVQAPADSPAPAASPAPATSASPATNAAPVTPSPAH